MFNAVLVANRGEIAVRVMRTLRSVGIYSVAIYSDADVNARHVNEADAAVRIGPAAARESYLSIERVVQAALDVGADALHPGYGFLSENAEFADACQSAGVVFIGPPASAIRAMGDKIESKITVAQFGVPVVPGINGRGLSDGDLIAAAHAMDFPVLIKPSAGGGGKGMRLVHEASQLAGELAAARRQARGAFGDDALLLERYVERPRHIEIQIVADTHGNVVHLGERECSLQRRHQKIIEESPSPFVTPDMRSEMGNQAIAAARACGYVSAGTVEFIVPGNAGGEFFFMEMNTRLQVEHPVTEMVYGVDLVEWQLRVAAGEALPLTQSALIPRGHAMEARVYAEDPANGFLPTGGTVVSLHEPSGVGVRVDSGLQAGTVVGSDYDPMLAKVITVGADRDEARRRLDSALSEYSVLGVTTNIGHLRSVLADPDVISGNLDTTLVETRHANYAHDPIPAAALAAIAIRHCEPGAGGSAWSTFGWRHGGRAPATIFLQERQDMVPAQVTATADGWLIGLNGGVAMAASIHEDGENVTCVYDGRTTTFHVANDGDTHWIGTAGQSWSLQIVPAARRLRLATSAAAGPILSPMPGMLLAVHVAAGDHVQHGQSLAVVEAMKMEHTVTAPAAGVVLRVTAVAGQQLRMSEPLMVLAPHEPNPQEDVRP
jgi:acetyl-CoA/propionyl-CoA carboxylase, biotin carboxylase, biotin carboxyl carrier protein